jgi:CAAX prenyl protease-like protein
MPWPAFVRCLPFAIFMVVLAVRGAVDGYVDTRWLYAVQAGAAALALGLLWPHYQELQRGAHRKPRPGVLALVRNFAIALLLGLLIAVMWVSLDAPWMRLGESAGAFVATDESGQLQIALIATRLAGACLVVPVMEELFWRSFLMRWLDDRNFLKIKPGMTSLFALVASSAVFALAHEQWLAGVIAGLMFAAIYKYTGRLWSAITAHATANLALGIYVVHQRAWNFW